MLFTVYSVNRNVEMMSYAELGVEEISIFQIVGAFS